MIKNSLMISSLSKLIHYVSKNSLEFLSIRVQDLGRLNRKSGLALKFLVFSLFWK